MGEGDSLVTNLTVTPIAPAFFNHLHMENRSMNPLRGTPFWIVLAGCSVLLAGCRPGAPAAKTTDSDRAISVRTVAVTTTEVQPKTLQPATVDAFYRSELRARASGFISEIHADIGDLVQAGDELAQIDVPELRKQREIIEARIVRLEAEEKRAAAGINLAEARVLSAQANLAVAESEMDRADATLAAAESEFSRTRDLVQRGSLQNRMLDEVRKKRDSELAGKQSVTSAIESAKADVAVTDAQKVAAQADLDAARAETQIARRQLEEMDVMIDFATIRAPISGVVTYRGVEPGDLVGKPSESVAANPLFVVSQINKLRVRIPVPESDAARVNPGDEVTLTFPSFAGEPAMIGNVTRRAGSLDPSTRTMLVEVELDNPDGKLLPGMFGQALINLSVKVAANLLPARAIRFSEDGKAYVYVVGQDETVSIASIETGMDDGNSIEVVAGLEPGQRVIDRHLKRFRDGQKVAVLTN
jgi:RND family efflux transporter MFP subunit